MCLRATGGGAWCNSIGKSGGAANGEIVGNKRSTATLGVDASFFQWFSDDEAQLSAELGAIIKDDLWPSPLQYYMSSEDDVDEEGAKTITQMKRMALNT